MKSRLLVLSLAVLLVGLTTSAFAGVIFDDGPTDGFTNALFIDGPNPGPFSQSISDQFVASSSGTASALDFGIWVPTGSVPTTVTWWLGTSAFAGDIGTGTVNNPGFTFLNSNGFGFDVYEVHLTTLSGNLTAGNTYFLTLGNANDSFGSQFDAWDINGGPALCFFAVGGVEIGGCGFPGEAFTLFSGGGPPPTVPEPASLFLLGTGLLGLGRVIRRKK